MPHPEHSAKRDSRAPGMITSSRRGEFDMERKVLCSGCLRPISQSLIHALPFFNADAGGYGTTYRCDQCWQLALAETRARIADSDTATQMASAAAVFQGHGIFLHEYLRGDPAPVLRRRLLQMLDLVGLGTICLQIDSLSFESPPSI